jgi:hypothetical protein
MRGYGEPPRGDSALVPWSRSAGSHVLQISTALSRRTYMCQVTRYRLESWGHIVALLVKPLTIGDHNTVTVTIRNELTHSAPVSPAS